MVIKRDAEKGWACNLMGWAVCVQHGARGVMPIVFSWAEDAPRGRGGAPWQGFVGKSQASSDVAFPFLALLPVIINQGHSSVPGLSEVIAISTGWALPKLTNSSFSAGLSHSPRVFNSAAARDTTLI